MARNDGMVENLAGDFQRRREPNFAWKSLVSATLALPGLRGAWCASDFDENGDLRDLTGQGRTCSYQGDPVFCHENLVPYCYYDGVGDYHLRADEAGLDIVGNESYVHADCQGLTLGGWWYMETFDAGANDGLIAKWDVTIAQRSYSLYVGSPALQGPAFDVSTNGVAAVSVGGQLITVQTWFFAAGRFTPSTSICVWTGGVVQGETASTFNQDVNAAGIPATLHIGTADLEIMSIAPGSAYPTDGKMAICWLSAEAISDSVVRAYWEQTRAMFNK